MELWICSQVHSRRMDEQVVQLCDGAHAGVSVVAQRVKLPPGMPASLMLCF